MRLHELFQDTLERMIGTKSDRLRSTLRSMRVKSKRNNPSSDLMGSEEQMSDFDQGQMPGGGMHGGRE
jgi:hypothetical protein